MPYDIGDALKRIEDILLGSIRRNMLRHVGEERREGFDWTMWQTEQLASIRRWSAANLKRHTKDFTRINNAAISLLQQSAVSAETQAEQTLLQTGIQQADEFFDIPDAKLDALLTATRQDLSTAEHALLRKADDVYRKAVFDANVYLQSGAGTMKDAVEMAVEDMRARGIRAVTYRNGAQVEASSYARMALRTANVRARMAGEGRARDKAGIHTVLVPPSGIACRRCAPWMGRVLVDDVYCSGTAQEAAELGVPLLSEAIAAGFLHPQCNCSPHMFLPGISKMPEVTPEDRDEAVRRYDLTQKQRYNERQIRKWKAIERDAPDARTREKAAARRRSWQQANKTLCDAEPVVLRRDYEREKLYELPDEPIVPEVIEKTEEAGEKAEVRETVPEVKPTPTPPEPEKSDLTEDLERGTINLDADEFVPCLKDARTGELLETEAKRVDNTGSLSGCTEEYGWDFPWNEAPEDCDVYSLHIKGSDIIEGLIALRPDNAAWGVYMQWGNAAPHNRGQNKKYIGVGGHLFAIAARISIERGYGGFIYADAANEDLFRLFVNKFGATPFSTRDRPYRFGFEGEALLNILNTYNFDWR